MQTLCFFNNKGGVGKTTLLANVAHQVASTHNLKVAVLDADPQCNVTQLVLPEDVLQEHYPAGKKRKLSGAVPARNILEVFHPIHRGGSDIEKDFSLVKPNENRFGVHLLPGHPGLAILEDKISEAWGQFERGELGGAKRTSWLRALAAILSDQGFDLLFVDVGPSLGALNRSILIGSDFFVTPMGCDIFSLIGIENIAEWLEEILRKYERGIGVCEEAGWSDDFEVEHITAETTAIARFAGYMVQQYLTKAKEGERRPTKAYERIRKKIGPTISAKLGKYLAGTANPEQLELGDVPHMHSLVPLAQSANSPVAGLTSTDGLVGTQYTQRDSYASFISTLAGNLLKNIGVGEDADG